MGKESPQSVITLMQNVIKNFNVKCSSLWMQIVIIFLMHDIMVKNVTISE